MTKFQRYFLNIVAGAMLAVGFSIVIATFFAAFDGPTEVYRHALLLPYIGAALFGLAFKIGADF